MLRVSLVVFVVLLFAPLALATERHQSSVEDGPTFVVAQATSNEAQKYAFESAKELGTVEAWDAFLSNYPEGFYADLARAYVKKLAAGETGKAQETQTAPPPAAPSEPPLPRVDLGEGSSRWDTGTRVVRIPGPIFNRQFKAAFVRSHGLEMVGFCRDPSQTGGGYALGMFIQEAPGGGYPKFSQRLRQGLAKKPNWATTNFKVLDITYSNGEAMPEATATPAPANGQWVLGPAGSAMAAQSEDLENFMAANSVTISAPPMVATFQLDGSRDAICEVMNACGAPVPGCVRKHRVTRQPDSGQDGRINCGRGRTWVGAQGKCVCVNDNQYWNGSRCVTRKRPRQTACTGGRTRDPQTGQCLCNGDSAWNGRACVKTNEPAQNSGQNTNPQMKQAVCGTLQIACSLGQKSACAKFNNGCR